MDKRKELEVILKKLQKSKDVEAIPDSLIALLREAVNGLEQENQFDSPIHTKRRRKHGSYQFKIELKDIRPRIWRRIQVPGSLTFDQLHDIFQTVMGWSNSHLYEFKVHSFFIGIPDGFFLTNDRQLDARETRISSLMEREKQTFVYTYDFGDNWEHHVTLESIKAGEEPARCLDGERACPPEDCGGPWKYQHDLANWEEDVELQEWYGDFDPEAFSVVEVNKKLGTYVKR